MCKMVNFFIITRESFYTENVIIFEESIRLNRDIHLLNN